MWRRKIVILAICSIIVLCGYAGIKALTPRYTATAQVMLQAKQDNAIDLQAVVAGFSNDSSMVRSEVDVLRSRALAGRVVDALGLVGDPEFHPKPKAAGPSWLPAEWLRTSGVVERLPAFLQDAVAALERRTPPQPIEETVDAARSMVVGAILDRLSVFNDGKSYTLTLSFESVDADKAARIVNAFAETYLAGQLEAKYENAERSATWLDQKLKQLRQRMQAADQAVQQYREAHQLTKVPSGGQGGGSTLANTQIGQLSEQLTIAHTARAQAETTLAEVAQLGGRPDGAISAPAVAASPVVQSLRIQEATLAARAADLAKVYGENHPTLRGAKAELDQVRAKLRQEVGRTVDGLQTAARQARGQEAELTARLRQLTKVDETGNRATIQLRQLESEADAARSLFDTFLRGFDRAVIQADARSPDARLLSRADAPLWPSYPQTRILLGLVAIGAAIVSIAVAFVLESMENCFRNPEELERCVQLPVLGMVPVVRGGRFVRGHLSVEALTNPGGSFAEALRSVRTLITHTQKRQRPPKVLLVTSAIPHEGKTSFAIALGRLTAQADKRVLLIEAELRRPGIAAHLGVTVEAGLAELLRGEATLDQVVYRDPESGLDFLPVRSRDPGASELLGTPVMAALIAQAAVGYDLVLIDTPPIAAAADALLLSDSVDAALLAVRWGKTPKPLVVDGVKKLLAGGMPLAGLVLLQVDVGKYASYGHGRHPAVYSRRYYSA